MIDISLKVVSTRHLLHMIIVSLIYPSFMLTKHWDNVWFKYWVGWESQLISVYTCLVLLFSLFVYLFACVTVDLETPELKSL